jgi:hypothetical protein
LRNFTMNFRLDETNDANHNAIRSLQCSSGNHLFWFQTRDGKLYGGNDGILGTIKGDIIIPEAYTDIIIFQLTFTWEARFMPEVLPGVSPITNDTGDQFPA